MNTIEALTITLDSIDKDQSDTAEEVEKLKVLEIDADKLMKNLRFIHDVFESTDGYTTDEEEDETYDNITKNLKALIEQLVGIQKKVTDYNETSDFEDVDTFEKQIISEIDQINQNLQAHKEVLEKIDWAAKLSRRKNELSEAQIELDEIISDGETVLTDITRIRDRSLTSSEENKELSEKFVEYVDVVTESISQLNSLKSEFESISKMMNEFEEGITTHTDQNLEFIVDLMTKNKKIKEEINNIMDKVESIDVDIDKIADERDIHMTPVKKKKYKAKKGDEIDELLGKLMNSSGMDIELKRVGDGKYMLDDKKISAKVVNGNLLVRVGGGYVTMEEYMKEFGQAKLERNLRRNRREHRKNKKSFNSKLRPMRHSGTVKVVGKGNLLQVLEDQEHEFRQD